MSFGESVSVNLFLHLWNEKRCIQTRNKGDASTEIKRKEKSTEKKRNGLKKHQIAL